MNNLSPFATAIIFVFVICLIIIICCCIFSSYVGSTVDGIITRNIQAIYPLNLNETISLINSIEPIINKYIGQRENELNQEEKNIISRALNSNLPISEIPPYINLKDTVVPEITDAVNRNINLVPIGIRNKFNNQIPEHVISRIIDNQFSLGINIMRGIQHGLGINSSERRF